MQKLAFIIRLFQDNGFHGGGEKIFYKLISKLIENNYLIDIYCSKTNVSQFPGINKIIVVDKPYNHTNPVETEIFYTEAKKLINQNNYDYVISENITPPIDITFMQGHSMLHRRRKLRNFLSSFLYNFRPVKAKRLKYERKWLNLGYKKIFVLSEILKKDLIMNYGISEDKISVIYPAVDTSLPEIQQENINYMWINKDHFVFGLSAPGFVRKGGYIFLKALNILKKQGYNFKARIIYPGYKKNLWVKILVRLYGIKDRVEFLPVQKDMQNFYNSIDCLVMPSIEETFGLVALEAMINKKISIVSSFCGAAEVLTDNYDSFIFDMSKTPSINLAKKMRFIIDNKDKLNEYITNGIETAKKFSWDRTYDNFINELLK